MLSQTQYACSSAAVRNSLVSDTQLTKDAHLCVLIDETLQKFSIARVNVDTHYYKGELEAMCMKAPIYDLVIGKIPGSRGMRTQK